MVAGDPFRQQVVVYFDPINGLLSAHDVAADGALTSRCCTDAYKPSAAPAISPDRDLLYIDDNTGERDELVVLRLSTGHELARVPLDASSPTTGNIFLGMNDDVYVVSNEAPGGNGLVSRVYERPGRRRPRGGRTAARAREPAGAVVGRPPTKRCG
jgi:hypothetical protein